MTWGKMVLFCYEIPQGTPLKEGLPGTVFLFEPESADAPLSDLN